MKCGRAKWQEVEPTRKDFNFVLTRREKFFTYELFKVIQDAISLILHTGQCINSERFFFEYINHIGCAINSHSIMNSGLIPGGQILSSEMQTVFFLLVDPMDKEHKDPNKIDMEAPRLARYKQKTWKRHQNTVYWVDIKLTCSTKRIQMFYQTRCNAIILYDTLPAYCISKVVVMKSCEGHMSHLDHHRRFLQRSLDERIGFRSRWKQQRHPTNPTKTKNPIIKNGKTRGWTRIHQGDRERYLV